MPKPIKERIQDAFKSGERELHFYDLAARVFPENEYPKAWRYSSNGGPPGCAMALGRAIREMGLDVRHVEGSSRFVRRPNH